VELRFVVKWENARDLRRALAFLCAWNTFEHRAYDLPTLYKSGVRYEREKRVGGKLLEEWRGVRALYDKGTGDCDQLACARVGELRARGERAYPKLVRSAVGYHVKVLRGSGRIEDPSVILGMRGAA
jgi:hypothetical protein